MPCIEVSADGICPKSCFGLLHSKWSDEINSNYDLSELSSGAIDASWHDTINSKTLALFQDCEVVVGSIVFLSHVFATQFG